MKLIIKLLLLTLVGAAALPFITLGPNGSALLKSPDLEVPEFDTSKISELVSTHEPISGKDQSAPVYKWRDSDGQTHYTTEPPPQDIQSETLYLNSDINVVPAVESPQPGNRVEKPSMQKYSVGSVYSPDKVQRLMDDARNVQNILNERANQMQRRSEME